MSYDVSVLGFGDNVVDIYVHKNIQYPGGNCVNFAVYAKMFGAKRAAYMGYFGTDLNASQVIEALEDNQIETIKCKEVEGENGFSRCTLKDGDRVFLDCNNGGVRGKNPFVLDRFDMEYLKQFDLVHSGNYCFTENELEKIHKAGILLSFDFSDDSDEEYYKRVAPNIDFAFCSFDGNEEEVKAHLEAIVALGPKIACASRGEDGCIIYDGNQFYKQTAEPLEKVEDTMGAGDSLITSFMVGYVDRLKKGITGEIALKESIAEAAKFAAKVCQINGAFGYGKEFIL